MQQRVVLIVVGLVGRVDGFHAQVEAQDEILEVEAHASPIAHRQLLEEMGDAELSSRLVGIVAQGPDVAGIDEQGPAELPEELCAVFGIQVNLHVARLVDEVDASVLLLVLAGSERAHAPSAHAVGSA